MHVYSEIRDIRGKATIDGIIDYLKQLEKNIKISLKKTKNASIFGNENVTIFGESLDNEIISGSAGFTVPEWLEMGENIEEWLAYALSLEMTNYYINSEERKNKSEKRRKWLRELKVSSNNEIAIENEKRCLFQIRNRKDELKIFKKYLKKLSKKSHHNLCQNIIEDVRHKIKKQNNDEFCRIAERKDNADKLINEMIDEAIELIKEKNVDWQDQVSELMRVINETEDKYNLPYMKALLELAIMTNQERLSRFGNIRQKTKSEKRSTITAQIRREVWRRDQGRCAKCGSRKNLEFDHIVPLSKGGSNTVRNIELLCQECNRKKSNIIM